MADLPHLRVTDSATSVPYVSPAGGGGNEFSLPVRNRVAHAQRLKLELQEVEQQSLQLRREQGLPGEGEGEVLAVRSDDGFELKLDSLERMKSGIELLSVGFEGGTTVAKLFVPRGKHSVLLRLIDRYAALASRSGRPRNQELVESIASIKLAALRDYWEDRVELFPQEGEQIWWEVWLRRSGEQAGAVHENLCVLARERDIRVSQHFVEFPERSVTLVLASREQISASMDLLAMFAELRRAKELATDFLDLPPREQGELARQVLERLELPPASAPVVCILDGGVNREHPLLAPALDASDAHAVVAEWGVADSYRQHGTGMAGIALYGCLTDVLSSGLPVHLRHRLESVKILPPPPQSNDERDYGSFTIQAVARAEVQAPARNRVVCMAVSADDRDMGLPSLWSAAVDQLTSGALDDGQRLVFLSAGNIWLEGDTGYVYHESNALHGVEDPGQSWNAVTVGAFTEKTLIRGTAYDGWQPVAPEGDLCPSSRTSLCWPDGNKKSWPHKPDIVMEGGNYIERAAERSDCEDLSLLTTTLQPGRGALFAPTKDTSPATASAARLAATVWSRYPSLAPQTVRGLLVHSASWTEAMKNRFPATSKAAIQDRLRCFGYGVPDATKALSSAANAATLIVEAEIQPYVKVGSSVRSKEMHVHKLPWPVSVLEDLGATDVSMRVTLSYFVEPSPGRIGWTKKHRYQSHGLRFDVNRPTENEEEFRQRLSRAEWVDPAERPDSAAETRNWMIGAQGRSRGSIHSDWWTGTASELASCGLVAVYPVAGWWRERPHLGKHDRPTKYSLIVSISTPDTAVDLYTPIHNVVELATELEIGWE